MGENTKIQWAHHTFNPWRGCTKVAAGCENRYADARSNRNPGTLGVWGPNGTRVVASESMWRKPLKWNREAARSIESHGERVSELDMPAPPSRPERPRVFCASLADVFEDWKGPLHVSSGDYWWIKECAGSDVERIGGMDDVRARLFALIDATPNLDWLLLTKRPENVRRMWPMNAPCGLCGGNDSGCRGDGRAIGFRKNVWLGTSIACQDDADRNIHNLLKCEDICPVRFVSMEPLIGPVNGITKSPRIAGLSWVIVGGESGRQARPCNVEWIRSIVRQCKDAGVPCFVKQIGARPMIVSGEEDIEFLARVRVKEKTATLGKLATLDLNDSHGGDMDEWPEDVRVREVPA